MAERNTGKGWLTEIYPESELPNWRDILSYMGMQAVIGPLHEFDVNADGSPKKPHYHVLLLWDGPTTYNNAKNVVKAINGVGCLKCITIRGSVRYFCHMDNPEKYQYSPDGYRQIGGVDIQKIIMSESDEDLMLCEIFDFIDENAIISYKGLIDYCRLHKDDWFHLIMHKHRENVWKYLRSYEYELKGYYDERKENYESTERS